VPFNGNPYAPYASPPPVLTGSTPFTLHWSTNRPAGYDNLDIEVSPNGVTGWGNLDQAVVDDGSYAVSSAGYYRARFTNGTLFTGFSNILHLTS
jgi:hypothetical protein